LLVGIPVALLAALVTSWFIAGRAVAPIQRLSDAARSVSPTSLGERIQVETTDHEISKLQSELNSALERLEAGYRAQEQFISNVSHELKTPLAVLLTETQILHLGQETLERYRGWAERVEEEMKRLAQLVESFLTLTRCDLASGLVRKDEVAVHDLVLDAIQHSTALARRRAVHLVPVLASSGGGPHGDGPVVKGDGDLLCTMLDNLLRNAIRFSSEGQSVDVRVTMDEDDVCITVRDRGPGIPDEFIDKVFDRFFQVPSDVGRQGSGIGLSIAHNVARLHDGHISVSNAPEGGCTFVVVLPLSAVGGLESVPVA
jgi:signal transduction histidine kinase